MLLFKTKGIILKIHKVNENDFLYTFFSIDYGKIICQKKKTSREKNLDIWYIINCEIETKEERKIHKMRNIKILHEFQTEHKTFSEMNSYLESIAIIHKNAPEWVPIRQIVELYERLYTLQSVNEEKLLILKLKLLNIFWILPNIHDNQTVQKILRFIDKSHINDVLKLTWLSKDTKKKLESIIAL